MITVSIASHGQGNLVYRVLNDLSQFASQINFEVVLTKNIPEGLPFSLSDFPYPTRIVKNSFLKGFGANHNAAFKLAKGDYFCVLNPDIRLQNNPFPALLDVASRPGIGVVAPRIINANGQREDSARDFPTPMELLRKALGGTSALVSDQPNGSAPDWVAGMFMLFPSSVFRAINGFDERYFLYYEDVDICARLALAGYKRLVCSDTCVIHEARRSSHRNARYAVMHLQSIARFFSSDVYRRLQNL